VRGKLLRILTHGPVVARSYQKADAGSCYPEVDAGRSRDRAFYIDILTRLGEAFRFQDLETRPAIRGTPWADANFSAYQQRLTEELARLQGGGR